VNEAYLLWSIRVSHSDGGSSVSINIRRSSPKVSVNPVIS
jgi:hypothetical protein